MMSAAALRSSAASLLPDVSFTISRSMTRHEQDGNVTPTSLPRWVIVAAWRQLASRLKQGH